jgi:hypothetical protein
MSEVNEQNPQILVCTHHSGFRTDITYLNKSVEKLQKKWDSMQKLIFVILGGVIMNLILIIINTAMKHNGN